MLPVPIETLRVRIGLESTDASRDDDIQAASDTSLALMGSYCDRIFGQEVDAVEVFTHVAGDSLLVKRYPIVSITSMVDVKGATIPEHHENNEAGLILFDSPIAFHMMSLTYTGGYAEGEFPPDLLSAYYAVFDEQFAAIDAGTAPTEDAIAQVTVFDVGTVRYDTSADDSGSTGVSYLPMTTSSILDNYKRYKC